MEPAAAEGNGGGQDRSAMLRRFGPLAAIVVVALVIVGLVVAGGGDDDGDDGNDGDAGASTEPAATDATDGGDGAPATTPDPDGGDNPPPDASDPATSDPATSDPATSDPADADGDGDGDATFPDSPLPEGVMSFPVAQELGIVDDIDWGPRCDVERGRVAVPDFFAPECYAPFEGDNGGATARGVTEDTIRIVYWQSQDADPILQFITSAILNDDTAADDADTLAGMIEYWETYYETYGRRVELIPVVGSGTVVDDAAARADAVMIDEDLDPFMVWGGPTLSNAFAEELAARGIPCLSCGPTQTREYYQERFPGLQYSIGKSGEQLDLMVAEYISKRLAGDPAIYAGDESMHDTERVFGRIWIESSAASVEQNERFEETLGEAGIAIAASQSYALDPATLQESAAAIIARMKEAGVTSVIINGDPIAPRDFTREATAQNYFPEWIVTGSVLIDTAAFSRTYDQEQWANAFGISNLSTRVDRRVGSSFSQYVWFQGEEPRADDNIGVITPAPQTFYSVLQAIGPNLTIESFNEAIFAGEPTARAVSAPSLSWGLEGIWPGEFGPDYHGVDDVSEVWWDPTAEGPDEIDNDGAGLWRWVDGGVRYKPGEIPEGPPKAFEPEGTVTIYEERPPGEATPADYEPLPPR